ncbi:MAG: hypothetical protein ACR2QK_23835 [Acidimicrobiales bacterium]
MTGKSRVILSVLWAIILGALVTLPLGGQRQLSVEIWLVAVAVWLALSTTTRLLIAAPVLPAQLQAFWKRRPGDEQPNDRLPRELRSLEGTMISARDNERAYGLRLRPRLKRVTDHHLKSRLGIDAELDPGRAAAVLGPLAWLVDGRVNDRAPDLDEVDRLLRLVSTDDDSRAAEHQPPDREPAGQQPGEQQPGEQQPARR